ncbi:MAG: MFS transporter [Gammaproteobacteria bacterium]|nr:MFS transporter [Gammaproteobacteria bacterium]
MQLKDKIYWRLSGFYFFYFASVGALFPYWGLFLQSNGYSSQQIANVFAVIMGTKLIAPYIWGWLADRTGKRMLIIRIASLFSILCFAGIFYSYDYAWLMLCMFGFSFFWNANLPQFEAVTFSHLGENTHRYSAIRLWGSLGFVLLVALLGSLLEYYGVGILPGFILVLLILIWFFSFLAPDKASQKVLGRQQSIQNVLFKPHIILFFVICLLLQASHGPYYAFFSIYLEDNGYSRTIIGQLWALGVLAEVVVFMVMHRLLPRWGASKLLMVALALTAIRWVLIGHYADSAVVLLLAQLLHAASFGVYHAASIHLVHEFFPGSLQGRGQALYSSLSFGAGGAIGAYYSGISWDSLGAARTYDIASGMAVAALLISVIFFVQYKKLTVSSTVS